jgi:uncharacterized membrane protein
MTEYTFQLNVKLGKGYDAHLVNITGVGAADFKENLQWVTENAAGIASTATALEAAYGVKEIAANVVETQVTNTQAPGQWADRSHAQPYQQPAVQQAPPNPGPVPSCQHGAMVLRPAGTSKNTGKAYNAFYSCTAGRDSGCRSVNT